mgnify:CR=1 FL=1
MSTIEKTVKDFERETHLMMTRRQLFGRSALGLGTAALAGVFAGDLRSIELNATSAGSPHPHQDLSQFRLAVTTNAGDSVYLS